jgi:hypothetical protein
MAGPRLTGPPFAVVHSHSQAGYPHVHGSVHIFRWLHRLWMAVHTCQQEVVEGGRVTHKLWITSGDGGVDDIDVVHRPAPPVYGLGSVLGTTLVISQCRLPTAEEKPGGQPVDNRWTAVDNGGRPVGCGSAAGFIPRFSTPKPPVDNVLTSRNGRSPQFTQHRRRRLEISLRQQKSIISVVDMWMPVPDPAVLGNRSGNTRGPGARRPSGAP